MVNNFLRKRVFNGIFDSDADLFIKNAGIIDLGQKSAINDLVMSLKSNNIWNKLKATYPFVGGTESQHKFNLKDPRDLDEAFRLNFQGTVTHSLNGIQGDGITGYADTNLNEQSSITLNSGHVGVYSITDLNVSSVELGVRRNVLGYGTQLFCRFNGNLLTRNQSSEPAGSTFTNPNSLGFFASSRISSPSYIVQINNNQSTANIPSTSLSNFNFFILARNNQSVAENFSSRQIAFATIGDGLSSIELTSLKNIINTFQTSLGRNV